MKMPTLVNQAQGCNPAIDDAPPTGEQFKARRYRPVDDGWSIGGERAAGNGPAHTAMLAATFLRAGGHRGPSRMIKLAWAGSDELGESPVWSDGALWWLDCPTGTVRRLAPEGEWHLGEAAGCLAPRRGGGFVVATGRRVVSWKPGEAVALIAQLPGGEDVVVNDGKVAPDGAFWIGTMTLDLRPGAGALHRVGPEGRAAAIRTGLTLPNGLAWVAGRAWHVDTLARTVTRIDDGTGFTVPMELGLPDGMCADAEGALWIAHWGGGCVRRWSTSGEVLDEVGLPVTQPSSVALGGEDGRTLFITTAWEGLDATERAAQPLAGSLFAARVTVPGPPADAFAG